MKRDLDLVREILFAVEENAGNPLGSVELNIENHSQQELSYHIMLLDQAGLIRAEDCSVLGPEGFRWEAKHLTWEGHEFIDAARDSTTWKKAKKKVADAAGGVIFSVLKDVLVAWARQSAFSG